MPIANPTKRSKTSLAFSGLVRPTVWPRPPEKAGRETEGVTSNEVRTIQSKVLLAVLCARGKGGAVNQIHAKLR